MSRWMYGVIAVLSGLIIWNFFDKPSNDSTSPPAIVAKPSKKPQKKSDKPEYSTEYIDDTVVVEYIVKTVILNTEADFINFKKLAPRYEVIINGTIDEVLLLQVKFTSQDLFDELMSLFPDRFNLADPEIISTPKPIEASTPTIPEPLPFTVPSDAGAGMVVAVLDTGVADLPIFKHPIEHIDFIDGDGTTIKKKSAELGHHHGTAVASLIASIKKPVLGLAPAAHILDIRVMNNEGEGSSFTTARGILAAVNNGATVINLSIGGFGDNPVLKRVIDYALSKNIIVVAATGNESTTPIAYPARFDGVIGVGAVDEKQTIAKFSNTGEQLDITAVGVNRAVFNHTGTLTYKSGTSFAAPVISGAFATLKGIAPKQHTNDLYSILLESCNEAGTFGRDPIYGDGIFQPYRFLPKENYTDIAIANVQAERESNSIKLLVSVENRGTEVIKTAMLNIYVGSKKHTFQLRDLNPTELSFSTVPLPMADKVSVTAEVSLDLNLDTIPSNNTVSGTLEIK